MRIYSREELEQRLREAEEAEEAKRKARQERTRKRHELEDVVTEATRERAEVQRQLEEVTAAREKLKTAYQQLDSEYRELSAAVEDALALLDADHPAARRLRGGPQDLDRMGELGLAEPSDEERRPTPRKPWHRAALSKNVGGATSSEYDGVGLPDLRAWLRYFEGVAADTVKRNPRDEGLDAEDEARRLRAEIAARERER